MNKDLNTIMEIKKNKMELIEENNSFYSILCSLKTNGGNKYCNYIFSKGNLFPVGVNFLSEKPKIKLYSLYYL